MVERIKRDTEIIHQLFIKHAPKERTWEPTYIRWNSKYSEATIHGYPVRNNGHKVTYKNDGVQIILDEALRTILGDTDIFTLQTVVVDGKEVYSEVV
ncbi:Hypothetical protein POVR1_LOCUS451 [uncultured virus]|nr:Hypothetical protein POVR1_LOCUS451 [uncultured virus]